MDCSVMYYPPPSPGPLDNSNNRLEPCIMHHASLACAHVDDEKRLHHDVPLQMAQPGASCVHKRIYTKTSLNYVPTTASGNK
jgi:hypothetical protein